MNLWHKFKKFRSFNAENLKSVGQRAAKLPAIKLWEWSDPGPTRTRAEWFKWGRGRTADFFLRPPTLTAGNFEALYLRGRCFLVTKYPHFYSIYLLTGVSSQMTTTVLSTLTALIYLITNDFYFWNCPVLWSTWHTLHSTSRSSFTIIPLRIEIGF